MSKLNSNPDSPFAYSFGASVGRGKDNIVVGLNGDKEHVVKWNHDPLEQVSSQEHQKRLLYKKRKYEMLKFFLGKFIPDSYFVLGNKKDGKRRKVKEYTVQQRVPNMNITSLDPDKRTDPKLQHNIDVLVLKLQNLYRALAEVNKHSAAQLDAKLDLGGLSNLADTHKDDEQPFHIDTSGDYSFLKSPNLLVDPKTLDLFCVDFDQGEWTSEMETAWNALMTLAKSRENIMKIIQLD